MSREKILIRTSWISTIGNAVLSVSKIIVGLLAGSLAVLGDGIDFGDRCNYFCCDDFYGADYEPATF